MTCILSIFLIISGGILFNYFNSFYVRDYFAAIGLRGSANLVEVFGEPTNIVDSTVYYEGVEFVVYQNWRSLPARNAILSANIVGSEIRFGRQNIGVGSTREEVQRAYRAAYRRGRLNEWVSPDILVVVELTWFQEWFTDDHIYNGGIWLWFYFDENNRVERIFIDPFYIGS